MGKAEARNSSTNQEDPMKTAANKIVVLGIGLALTLLSVQGIAEAKKALEPPRGEAAVKIKIDLSSGGMNATKTGVAGSNDRVRITMAVRASAPTHARVCSGPFKVKLEKESAAGAWVFVRHAGVANLCVNPAVRTLPMTKVSFDDQVPSNLHGAQKYRAVIDYTGMVAEANEGNNVDGTRYIP